MAVGNQLVSVVMPVHNGGAFLADALESVRRQDGPHLEIVAVNDGSTDHSAQILRDFAGHWPGPCRILAHPRGRSLGIAASYLLGLEHSRGKYIAFLEQDDAWSDDKISRQCHILETLAEVGVVFSDVYPWDRTGTVADEPFKCVLNKPPKERPFRAFWRLMWGNFVLTFSNLMVRRDLIRLPHDIVPEPAGFQDWMLLFSLSNRCKFYHCGNGKVFWRQRTDSYYAGIRRRADFARQRRRVLRNGVRLRFGKSVQ